MQKKIIRFLTLGIFLIASGIAFANAPVVDLSQENSNETTYDTIAADTTTDVTDETQPSEFDTQSLSLKQRVARSEQQLTNLTQMNFPAKIEQLQQQVQQLQGQLEDQAHQLQTMSDQQKNFYQDLDQRINQLQGNPPAKIATTAASATTNTTSATKSGGTAPTATKTASANISAGDSAAYQAAFDLLQNKQYDQAAAALKNYLTGYPQGQFAANAYFWLGEIYYAQSKWTTAATQFQSVITQFPKDNKVPDAMLKLAFVHAKLGKKTQAKQELQQIMQNYPKSSAAQLAKLRLQTMSTNNQANGAVRP